MPYSETVKFGSDRFYNTGSTNPNVERIHHLRRLVLVHSVIYYNYDSNLVPDHIYDGWARELAELQNEDPRASSMVWYMADAFASFSGSVTGFNLPLDDEAANNIARFLLSRKEPS